MQAEDYSRLALRTESPVGTETITRYATLSGYILQGMKTAYAALSPFDKMKRSIYYAEPGASEDRFVTESRPELRTTHGFLGLLSEVHELLERYIQDEQLDRTNLLEELGDCIWYINLIADANGISLEEILEKNLAKLNKRNKDKGLFDLEGTLDRDLQAEHNILASPQEVLSQKQKEQLLGYNKD